MQPTNVFVQAGLTQRSINIINSVQLTDSSVQVSSGRQSAVERYYLSSAAKQKSAAVW